MNKPKGGPPLAPGKYSMQKGAGPDGKVNYTMTAKGGSYSLAEGLSNKIELRDYLLPLHTFYTMTMPATVGKYEVLLEAEGYQQSAAGDSTYNHIVPVYASLTMEEASPPSAVLKIPALSKLPVIKALMQPTQALRGEVENPDTKELEEIDLTCPTVTLHLVPQAALLEMVWKRYKINLFSLKASLDAIKYQGVGNMDWAVVAEALGKQAFGHPAGTQLGDSHALPDIPDFVPTTDGSDKPAEPFPGPASAYYRFTDVYYLVAFLELVKAGDIKLPLPDSNCLIYFPEPNEDKAFVRFLDTWEAPVGGAASLHPLEALKEYGKTADQIRELFRYRSEIEALREKRRDLLDKSLSLWLRKDVVDVYLKETTPNRAEALAEVRKLYQAEADLQEKALPLYAELTYMAAKRKEKLLKVARDKARVSVQLVEAKEALKEQAFIPLPNNMGKMPAHFAAIPAGLENGLEYATDLRGQSILRVRRKGLEIDVGKAIEEHTPFTLPLLGDESERKHLAGQVGLLFGPKGPRYLVPQGLVAVSKLYNDLGGNTRAERVVRLYLNDWIDTMRPLQVARFKQKGRGAAFGHEHKPIDLFNALLGVLSRLTYDSGAAPKGYPNWDTVNGFYTILGDGSDGKGFYVDVMLNPKLHSFVIGDGAPYMITNTKAMFEYDSASLDYTPAAQMWIETLARNNMMKSDTATIATPGGDGFTRYALAQGFGLQVGPNEGPKHVLNRFNRILDNLQNAGVLAGWKTDGRDKTGGDAFGVKLHLTMHEDYRKAYDLTRLQTQDKELDRQLATPFAEPKKLKSTYATPAAKKRGRPKKA